MSVCYAENQYNSRNRALKVGHLRNFMQDDTVTIHKAKKAVEKFVTERDWQKFHTPKNLSMNIVVEASELVEIFLWVESVASVERLKEKRKEIEDEVADVLIALLDFCNVCDIDLGSHFLLS